MRASGGKGSVIYAILSNTIVLVLIGFFSILYLHTNSITNLVKEKISILVELKSDSVKNDYKPLMKMIATNNKVIEGSVKYINKEFADTIIGLDISKNLETVGNPFHDIVSFNIKAEFYSESNILKIKNELKKRSEVFDVFYEHVVIDNLKSNLKSISFIVLILSLVFVVLAIIIIFNTINLSLYADRWEIKTMEITKKCLNTGGIPDVKVDLSKDQQKALLKYICKDSGAGSSEAGYVIVKPIDINSENGNKLAFSYIVTSLVESKEANNIILNIY